MADDTSLKKVMTECTETPTTKTRKSDLRLAESVETAKC